MALWGILPAPNILLRHRDRQGREALTRKEGQVSHIFVSDMAKAKIINEKTAYEELKHQKIFSQLTYYTRSYSTTNDENIEYGPGFILSFIENTENNEGYILAFTEDEFPIFVGPSAMSLVEISAGIAPLNPWVSKTSLQPRKLKNWTSGTSIQNDEDTPVNNRAGALRNLTVGDIFHARNPKTGASLVCLVTAVDDGLIYARRIHTQDEVRFDRNTGLRLGKGVTKIDCVAPLPSDIRATLVQMDQRYQVAYSLIRQGIEVDPREARYTPDERRAHDFLDQHISANPI
jgi:hypothetical protein